MLQVAHSKVDNNDTVTISNLRVTISGNDKEGWFAKGVEINYFSCGWTMEEVMDNFSTGLAFTIKEHLARHNSVEKLLCWSSVEEIQEVFTQRKTFHTVGSRNLSPDTAQCFPYDGLSFIAKESREAA